MTGCACRDCKFPTVGDPEVKASHAEAHRLFALFLDDRADAHGFREPTTHEILRWTIEEYDVPARCPRAEHQGAPQHPVHRA